MENLDPSKASGPDGISPRILKELAPELAPALTTLFRSSLKTGEVPLDWRTANVTPVFKKKGEKHKPENYRPISLTSTVCKVMEHILVSHIMKFAEKNILCKEQHGFRKGRNCESQLIGLIDQVTDALENGQDSDVLVMDFSKAFDKVSHSLLTHKLNHYGITGELNRWIGSFLGGRRQAVVVEGEASSFVDVASGVPQGSVLGPCLFLLYINDLPKNLNSTARLFADDTLCHTNICSNSDTEALQEDLAHLSAWEQTWCMEFHPDKCQALTVSKKRQRTHRTYKLRDHALETTQEATYLGIALSDDLRWDAQVKKIVGKANKALGFLRRNLRVGSRKLRELAYFALVRPCVEYAAAAWDPYSSEHIKAIEQVQRRAARWVTSSYRQTTSVTALLSELNWESLESRRRKARLSTMWKYVHGHLAIDSPAAPQPLPANPNRRP